ncbi:hypothetical protein GC176_22250 [bacterium]|nr:hypothetical protein [bacterium]
MLPSDFDDERRFHAAWDAVEIVRPVSYSLFTFGSSELPYYLVCPPGRDQHLASVRKGQVNIDRPLIITPDTMHPEFRDFFEDAADEGIIDFLLARTASFSNLKLTNRSGETKLVSDSVEEIVSRLNRQLDDEEEDRVAILTAPSPLAGVAVLKYATERVLSSAPDNVQELRERGLLP